MHMTLPIEALIFDMDGTMIDSMPWHAKSLGRVRAAAMAWTMTPAEEILRRTTGRTGAECMREVLFERELRGTDELPGTDCMRRKTSTARCSTPVFTEVERLSLPSHGTATQLAA
jgi:beta-phosphoglucomutase-like phosphatase (HAD superfamily)